MKREILIAISIVVHFFSLEPILAQDKSIETLLKGANQFQETPVSEKVYLHTDKNMYLAGEIAWFKIYNLNANNHFLSDLSTIVYVELFNADNEPTIQLKIPVKNGLGEGSIDLPSNLKSGNYVLRAYTHWMKNFNDQLFFQKSLQILNTEVLPEKMLATTKDSILIHFYPESGNLLTNVQNTVAFKTTDHCGIGIDTKGYLINSQSDTIARFSTQHHGMGKFEFTPTSKESYTAVFTDHHGKQYTSNLPKLFDRGVLIQLKQSDSLLTLNVVSNRNANYVFIVQSNNTIDKNLSRKIGSNEHMTIPIGQLTDGINIFTVLDDQFKPMAERLFFKYPTTTSNLSYQLKKEISNRSVVQVQLALKESNGNPISAYASAAVYKYDSIVGIDSLSIQDYLLLGSNLTESIESPFSYFNPNKSSKEKNSEMDLLMLTHGWRKYNWTPHFLPETNGHFIRGKVIMPTGQKLEDRASIFLSTTGITPQFKTAPVDSLGQFHFILPEFYNNGQIILQKGLLNASSKLLSFSIQDPFSNKPTKMNAINNKAFPMYSINKAQIQLEIQNKFGLKSEKFAAFNQDTLSFYGKPNNQYLLDNYVRFNTLEEVLREYVSPVMLRKKNDQYFINAYDAESTTFFTPSPLVLMDGVPQLDFNSLLNTDPLKIKKLEVVDRTYYYGNNTFYGILHFTSYNGNNIDIDIDQHLKIFDYKGLEKQRIFYTPTYKQDFQKLSRMPDFRTLLSWQPQLVVSAEGKLDMSFFTSDVSGNFVISIQGISEKGIPIHQLIPFKVQ